MTLATYTMNKTVNLKEIRALGGDVRAAFEELSYQLFTRHFPGLVPIRREGAGGDAGLEGVMQDSAGNVLAGLQAKFFADKLENSQWRSLDQSIRTALADNATDASLREIVVTLPRNLTAGQVKSWNKLCKDWAAESVRLGYRQPMAVTLWDESHLRGLLLSPANRGLLLHYFEYPDFDLAHCHQRTLKTIEGLGDRYQPELHTQTEAEDKLHSFLRTERCRRRYLERASGNLSADLWELADDPTIPAASHSAAQEVEAAWSRVLSVLGDGVSLPVSFGQFAEALNGMTKALQPLLEGIEALIPERETPTDFRRYMPRSRSVEEEKLDALQRGESQLRSLANFLREEALADAQCLLLTGSAGAGKTQVLAEVCQRYREQGGVVLFTEGAKFSTQEPPWTQFLRWSGFQFLRPRELIETLAAMAASTSLPTLICIDALNETPHRGVWQNGLLEFAAELSSQHAVKLLVSCRDDYVEHTLPIAIRERRAPGWAFASHEGLGFEVLNAFPRYIAAYRVRWQGLPPLVQEFRNPLFLRIFCEAFADQSPGPGSLSLGRILERYAHRKAELIAARIDCSAGQVLDALRELAGLMQTRHALQMSEREARAACERHYGVSEVSRSLYQALLSEGVLAEYPDTADALGSRQVVRFTYERVWDYFISLSVLPRGELATPELLTKLRDESWRYDNAGLISLLHVRFSEEGLGELCDAIWTTRRPEPEELEEFLDSVPWRTQRSVSSRTWELFKVATHGGSLENALAHIVPLAPNPYHPWNADWLHEKLAAMPLAERDRTWTSWVNRELSHLYEDSPLRELLTWAEQVRMEMLGDEHRFLLATVLAWCASATVVEARKRLAPALTRLVAGRPLLAAPLVARFLIVDDAYVREWVFLAAAGAAQHASAGDPHLRELARVVHRGVFASEKVEPHLLIRHYAAEVCEQAEAKGTLPEGVSPASFRLPYHSDWPKVWTKKKFEAKKKAAPGAYDLYRSVVPDVGGAGYGDWGRYVMQSHVQQFLPQKLSAPVGQGTGGYRPRFDATVCSRYVVQRVFEFGWDPGSADRDPELYGEGRNTTVERLSKKYQWIALYEFLGYLSDHYHFHDYDDPSAPFRSARQLIGSDLLDPFIVESGAVKAETSWNLVRSPAPWWSGHLDPLPRPLSAAHQREFAGGIACFHPATLLAVHDGQQDWLTLSAYHEWNEPRPVWLPRSPAAHVHIAIRSYCVAPKLAIRLLEGLSCRGFHHDSTLWLDEPEFDQPLSTLRTFPLHQEDLRSRCELDEWAATHRLESGAWCATCRCAPNEEQESAPVGSMPSPQLAEAGNLRWLGHRFDFGPPGANQPLVSHFGRGFRGACAARRDPLISWLKHSGRQLVWRCFVEKHLLDEPPGRNSMRAYWGTFTLNTTGEISFFKGGTCNFPNGPGPEEPSPWA